MLHTRYSTPEIAIDDPVVEIHESQLKMLRARANLAIPSAIIGLVALALIGAGVIRVERSVRALEALAEGRTVAVAHQVDVLSTQLAERTSPELISQLALRANAGSIERASTTARQALSIARETSASVVPVTEHLALVDGRLVEIRSDLNGLSEAGTAQGAQLAVVSKDLGAFRASQDQRLESLSRQIRSQDARLNLQDQEVRSAKTWTKVVGAGTAVSLGIVAAHTLGHDGR